MLSEAKTSLAFGAGEIVQWFREHLLLFLQFLGPSRTPVSLYALFWLLWVLHAHGSFTYMQTLNKNLAFMNMYNKLSKLWSKSAQGQLLMDW